MKRFHLMIASTLLCAVLIWCGLKVARADVPATLPSTDQVRIGTTAESSTQPLVRNREAMPLLPGASSNQVRPMPREYFVLLNRSMFVRGHVAEAGHAGGRNNPRTSEPTTAPSLARAESGLVFNGVTQTANAIDALVEDTATGRVLTVHSGDAIARGKVGKITMDTLEYVNGGKVTNVQIGQNFVGESGDVSASPATSAPPTSGAGAPSGASPQDILERLRQKRLQELGGK